MQAIGSLVWHVDLRTSNLTSELLPVLWLDKRLLMVVLIYLNLNLSGSHDRLIATMSRIIRVPNMSFLAWQFPLLGRCHDLPLWHSTLYHTAIIDTGVSATENIAEASIGVGVMDLNLSFVHLCWEVVIFTSCFLFLLYLIENISIAMILVQHVIELSVSNCWPYNDFLPVCKATTVIEWRNGILVVHMLQLLLGSQTNLYQVGMEAT